MSKFTIGVIAIVGWEIISVVGARMLVDIQWLSFLVFILGQAIAFSIIVTAKE